ncbi:MAG: DUF2793 domain-containing protein [Pseudomonadota bacterium]
MSQSPRLKLSYILPQQAQKHVSANESFRRLDALVQLSVKSVTLAAEPSAPAEGDAYILPAGASGASWGLLPAGAVAAFQDGQWLEHSPRAGWRAYVESAGKFYLYNGAQWNEEAASGSSGAFATLGVNAAADAINKLAVKSDAALFSHDDATPGTGDARLVVNKSSAAKTASVVFQNGYSGRAEFGLAGSDDFSLKVSADGAAWINAIVVKPDGKVGLNTLAPAAPFELHVDGAATAASLISSDDLIITKESGASAFAGVVAAASSSARMVFKGTRARGSLSAPAAASDGDFTFSLLGAVFDGVMTRGTAGVEMRGDGAGSSGVAPQRIEFATGAAGIRSERMRITSGGDVGIGVTAPSCRLDVDGAVKVKSFVKTALP